MKFFIDTANLDQIKEAQDLGILDGVTTNPSLMAKEGITGEENDGQVQGLENGFRTSTGEGSRPQHQAIVSALTADGKDVDTVAIPQGEGIQASQEAGIVSAKTADRQAIDVDDLIRHTRYLTVLMEELCTEDFLKFVRSITLRMENLNAIRLGLCIRGITIESHVLDLPANFTE